MSRNLFEVPNDARVAVVMLLDSKNNISILPLTRTLPSQALTVIFDGWSSMLCGMMSMNGEFREEIQEHLDEDQIDGVLNVLKMYSNLDEEEGEE